VPPDFTGTQLSVPHTASGVLYLKLRDDSATVHTLTLPVTLVSAAEARSAMPQPPAAPSIATPPPAAEPSTPTPDTPALGASGLDGSALSNLPATQESKPATSPDTSTGK